MNEPEFEYETVEDELIRQNARMIGLMEWVKILLWAILLVQLAGFMLSFLVVAS